MTGVAVTERREQILPPRSESSYRFPTDQEATEALCGGLGWDTDRMHDGRHRRRINHIIQTLQYFHRIARATGQRQGEIKHAALAASMYPGIEDNGDAEKKRPSTWRWMKDLEAAGLARIVHLGGSRGLGWELLDDWRRYAGFSRGYSSVGGTTPAAPCEVRRRPENRSERQERRVRPHCRKVGNNTGSVGRLEAVGPSSKSPNVLKGYGLGSPLKGVSQPVASTHTRGGAAVDASALSPQAAAAAAEDARKRRAWWVVGEAERLFAGRFGPPPDGPLVHVGPLLQAVDRFDRAAVRLAELHGREKPFGWPEPGLSYLSQLIGEEASLFVGFTPRPRPRPRHLGYFVRPLLAEARRNEKRCRIIQRTLAHRAPILTDRTGQTQVEGRREAPRRPIPNVNRGPDRRTRCT